MVRCRPTAAEKVDRSEILCRSAQELMRLLSEKFWTTVVCRSTLRVSGSVHGLRACEVKEAAGARAQPLRSTHSKRNRAPVLKAAARQAAHRSFWRHSSNHISSVLRS